MQFRYMGIEITSNQGMQKEIKQPAVKANTTESCLNTAVWYNKKKVK